MLRRLLFRRIKSGRSADQRAGLLVVVGPKCTLKDRFCAELAKRTRGAVLSAVALIHAAKRAVELEQALSDNPKLQTRLTPLQAALCRATSADELRVQSQAITDGRPADPALLTRLLHGTIGWSIASDRVKGGGRERCPWPRILVDFAQTRSELSALESVKEGPRVLMAFEIGHSAAALALGAAALRASFAMRSSTSAPIFEADGRLMKLSKRLESPLCTFEEDLEHLSDQARPLLRGLGIRWAFPPSPIQAIHRIQRATRRHSLATCGLSNSRQGKRRDGRVESGRADRIGVEAPATYEGSEGASERLNRERPWTEGCLLSGRALAHLPPEDQMNVQRTWRPSIEPLLAVGDLVNELSLTLSRVSNITSSPSPRSSSPHHLFIRPSVRLHDLGADEPRSALLTAAHQPPHVPHTPPRRMPSYQRPRSSPLSPEARHALLHHRPAPASPLAQQTPKRMRSPGLPGSPAGSLSSGVGSELSRRFAAPRKEKLPAFDLVTPASTPRARKLHYVLVQTYRRPPASQLFEGVVPPSPGGAIFGQTQTRATGRPTP